MMLTVSVSPDGTQLAYLKSVRTDAERARGEAPSFVEVMPSTGGAARQVIRDPVWGSGHRYNTLGWTPEGRFIMVVRDDGLLWRVPVDGSEPEPMGVSIKGRLKGPSIHPDGSRIVFSAAENDDGELWELRNFLPR